MIDLRQTSDYAKYMSSIGWIVERKDGVNYFIKKFPLIGSFIKIQRPKKIDFDQITTIAKKYRAFQIIIEPILPARFGSKSWSSAGIRTNNHNLIILQGYKQSKSPYLPSKTIYIDLTKSEKVLLKEMHYKTRYNIKKASQNSTTKSPKFFKIQISYDIEKFADFWQECARNQRGMFLSQKKEIIELYKAFGENAHLILVYHKDTSEVAERTPRMVEKRELVSGILMIRTKDIAYYMYAAASDAGKKLFAPTLCAWEAIKLSKKHGSKIFDFEGIYDERFPLKSWHGFTRFKKSFGGREIEYPGAFVKYRIPI